MPSSRIIWNGNPGEQWVNRGQRLAYQLLVDYKNSCGFCIQYDRAISNWWPLPFHRNCRCRQCLILRGASSSPFVDFREKLASLPKQQQTTAIGRSNFTLLERGVVKWEQIVTETRVKSFAEVVQSAELGLPELLKNGIRPDLAEHAISRINTPRQLLVRERRAELIKRILNAGISPEQLKEAVSTGVAQRIGIAAGPSGASPVKPPTRPSKLPESLRAALGYFGKKVEAIRAHFRPKPKPKEPDAKPPDSTD